MIEIQGEDETEKQEDTDTDQLNVVDDNQSVMVVESETGGEEEVQKDEQTKNEGVELEIEEKKEPENIEIDSKMEEKYSKERQNVIKLLANPPTMGVDVMMEVYSGMERFIIERIIAISKELELSDEMTADLLHANQTITEKTQRKMRRINAPSSRSKRKEKSHFQDSLFASGLLS